MGRNFDDYPGFQPFRSWANTYAQDCKSLFTFSTVLGAVIKCKQYSDITVESGTPVKSVKITLNIFAVHRAVET